MTKLIVKCGDIEVEYDGSEDFLKEELSPLIRAIADLRRSGAPEQPGTLGGAAAGGGGDVDSVSVIAQRLSARSLPDLICAAAFSYAAAGKLTFTKKELRDRIKEATGFYKATFAGNFDKTITRLSVAGKLHHNGGTNYSLPAEEKAALATRLKAQ